MTLVLKKPLKVVLAVSLGVGGLLAATPNTSVFAEGEEPATSEESTVSTEEGTATQEETVTETNVSQELIDKADQYVTLNESGEFIVDPLLAVTLSEEELKTVEASIAEANANNSETIDYQALNPGTVYVTETSVLQYIPDSEIIAELAPPQDGTSYASYYSGVTRIYSYWWGYKVYLSKAVVNTAGGGVISAAGFFVSTLKIPTPAGYAIAFGLGAAGYLGTNIPYGVELRINKTFVSSTWRYIPTGVKYQSR